MEKWFGNYFLGNLISVTQNNVFGVHFAIISGVCFLRLFLSLLRK